MAAIEWTPELEIGVPVIDGQHRRIVDYINRVDGLGQPADQAALGAVLDELVDYTHSHFAFEEALMEEVGYAALAVHQGTHRAFSDRVRDLKGRLAAGEDVSATLAALLRTWLVEHIRHDDTSYADLVRERAPGRRDPVSADWISQALARFFRG